MTVIVVGYFVKNGRVYHMNVQIVVRYLHWVNLMNPYHMNWRLIVQIKFGEYAKINSIEVPCC
jgi:hypothetical protein